MILPHFMARSVHALRRAWRIAVYRRTLVDKFFTRVVFMLEDGLLSTRPMKGTALRDDDPARDAANAEAYCVPT